MTARVGVELGQEVLLGEGEAPARVVDLVAGLLQLEAVLEGPHHQDLEGLGLARGRSP